MKIKHLRIKAISEKDQVDALANFHLSKSSSIRKSEHSFIRVYLENTNVTSWDIKSLVFGNVPVKYQKPREYRPRG